jgi:hypothetical protein
MHGVGGLTRTSTCLVVAAGVMQQDTPFACQTLGLFLLLVCIQSAIEAASAGHINTILGLTWAAARDTGRPPPAYTVISIHIASVSELVATCQLRTAESQQQP